eukprot:524834_1
MSAETAFGWIGFIFNIFLTNVLAYGLWNVYSKRTVIQWSARHFEQLYYALILSLLFIFVERNIQLLGGIIGAFELPFVTKWFLNNLFGTTFLGLFLLRAWLVHFDFNSGKALVELIVNPELKAEHKEPLQWFLDNKRNYGSPKYLTRFTFAMVFGINLFMLIWSLIAPASFMYAMVFIYAVIIIISISVTRHFTVVNDNFFIGQEILLEFRICASMFVIGGILIIFGPVMGFNWLSFWLIELSCVCIFLMCAISTYWVLRKTIGVGLDSVDGIPTIPLPTGAPALSLTLKNKNALTEFIKHLTQEISVESIFFLSDIMAYKMAFIRQKKLKIIDGFKCLVPGTLSRLIYRRTFTHYAWAISKTYIDGSSSLYVTAINEDARDIVTEWLEEQDPTKENSNDVNDDEKTKLFLRLQKVFDECGTQVYKQIQKSYNRFAYTPEFKMIIADKN